MEAMERRYSMRKQEDARRISEKAEDYFKQGYN
jgi:hypothetical protein